MIHRGRQTRDEPFSSQSSITIVLCAFRDNLITVQGCVTVGAATSCGKDLEPVVLFWLRARHLAPGHMRALLILAVVEAAAAAVCTKIGSDNYGLQGSCVPTPYFFCPDPLATNFEVASALTEARTPARAISCARSRARRARDDLARTRTMTCCNVRQRRCTCPVQTGIFMGV